MEREELYNEFVRFLHEYYTKDQITPQTCLGLGGLELDSLDIAEVLVEFEYKYHGRFKEEPIMEYQFYTIDEILDRFTQKNS